MSLVALPVCPGWGPAQVYAMGQAMQPLRERGVLVVGTGSMTHNLAEFFGGERAAAPYVVEFSRWVEAAVERGDLDALLDYRSQPPVQPGYLTREVMYGSLAMDSFALPALPAVA